VSGDIGHGDRSDIDCAEFEPGDKEVHAEAGGIRDACPEDWEGKGGKLGRSASERRAIDVTRAHRARAVEVKTIRANRGESSFR